MITIYHNKHCSKSREGLEKIKNSGKDFNVREYLKDPLSKKELSGLIKKLNILPSQLIRSNEKKWKEFKDRDLNEEELIAVMVEHPELIERPIVENEETAVIGRPSSQIEKIL